MTSIIIHRGPDDSGYYISKDRKVGFGHRRLSIIDLTKNGHQPMSYLNRYYITFNGEIYNFQEEKAELEKMGYLFKSNSDTEVILALYAKYGKRCLSHLRGMFAFCIYDEKNETLFMARDRLGVKPFKYFLTDNVLIFASELKAILTQPEVKRIPDYKAIQQYLVFGYIPAPTTGFVGIKKLEPGHYLYINLKRKTIEKKRYWEPDLKEKLVLSEKEWQERILDMLTEATRLRMISDVEVGAFLSGGVDSSGVVATMAGLSDKPIKTFTVAFKDKVSDESKYATRIAKMYHTDHHVLLAKPESAEILPTLAYQYEEPFADSSSLVTYMVNRLASKHVKVILNGDGGDENFAGYPNRHFRLNRDVNFDTWSFLLRPLALSLIKTAKFFSSSPYYDKFENFLIKSKLPLYQRFASYNQIFAIEEMSKYLNNGLKKNYFEPHILNPVKKTFDIFKGHNLKDLGLKFDLLYWLPDDLLTKVDIAGMAYSLENRSPFLDQELTELACQIPFGLKVKNGETKYILKKALEKIVPKENLYRPKMGFTIPLNSWFKGKLNAYGKKVLLSKNSQVKDMFDKDQIKYMLDSKNENEDFGPRLWSLMFLELWFKSYFS
jgi:asparagine synthase (glutamine-hydrolysing)